VSQTNTAIPRILYVDDDRDDCVMLMESFAANTSNTDVVHMPDGEEAALYLDSVQKEALPSLIILDLNMPKWDGRQTLRYIRSQPRLSGIPVVILSTSQSKLDKEVCTRLGANSYMEKPNHFGGYNDIVKHCLPLLR
jgi:CheY-like chemotaxis protein